MSLYKDQNINERFALFTWSSFSQLSKLLHHLLVIIKPRPNPNCPSYLLPAVPSRGKQKTGICRRTTSPRWEQTIVWEDLSMEEVKNNCSLYH